MRPPGTSNRQQYSIGMEKSQSMHNLSSYDDEEVKPQRVQQQHPDSVTRKRSMPNIPLNNPVPATNASPRKPFGIANITARFKAPEVIKVEKKEDDLGSFLSSLKKDNSKVSVRKSYNVI
jgi:hypothetical protein